MSTVKTLDVEAKEVKTIGKEELKTIQEAVQKQNQVQMQIGGIEGQKALLLDALKEASNELSKRQKDLEGKYGNISINLANGEITDVSEAN